MPDRWQTGAMMTELQTPPYRYNLFGLILASDVTLPMRTVLPPGEPRVDVTLRVGEVPDRLDQAEHHGPTWTANASRFLLDLPGIGRFLAHEGRQLTIQPAPGIAVDDILVFATGTGLAAILYQRGALLLHGSAVIHDGRAFVFCGPSGAGKSTLAGALCRSGSVVAADDICAVEESGDGAPLIRPDGQALRLYADSIERVGLQDSVGPRVRRWVEKFHVAAPALRPAPEACVPLAAVYMLADANPVYPPGITALPAVAAAQALLRQSYRRRLALAYSACGQPAARTAALLSRAGVYRLHKPRDFAQLDDTVARLHAHWGRLPALQDDG